MQGLLGGKIFATFTLRHIVMRNMNWERTERVLRVSRENTCACFLIAITFLASVFSIFVAKGMSEQFGHIGGLKQITSPSYCCERLEAGITLPSKCLGDPEKTQRR